MYVLGLWFLMEKLKTSSSITQINNCGIYILMVRSDMRTQGMYEIVVAVAV